MFEIRVIFLIFTRRAKTLIEYAAKNGVPKARQTLIEACSKGLCDDEPKEWIIAYRYTDTGI